jgi:hypothetical protein
MLSNVDTEIKYTDYENATTSTEVYVIYMLYCVLVLSLFILFHWRGCLEDKVD